MDARQLPHVWKWFCALPLGSDFLIGTEVFFKAGLFLADSAERRYTAVVWPFRRVRTTTLARDALPGGKSSRDLTDATTLALYAMSGDLPPELQKKFLVDMANREINSKPFISQIKPGTFPGPDDCGKPEDSSLYAFELRRRYPIEGTRTGRLTYDKSRRTIVTEGSTVPAWAERSGYDGPFVDDGRTGPSA